MGKKEKHRAEQNFNKTVSAAPTGEINSQKEGDGDGKAEEPKITNALASLEAVLGEVQASQKDWGQGKPLVLS